VARFKLIALLVLVALVATLVQPPRAEALEPTAAIAIAGVAVALIIIVVFVVIANVREGQTGAAAVPVMLAYDAGGVQSQ
jgi:hypothetical protein